MDLEFEAAKRLKLEEEHRWTALIDGDGIFSGGSRRRRNVWAGKKAHVKRSAEQGDSVDNFGGSCRFCYRF